MLLTNFFLSKVFFITAEEYVSAPSYPSSLAVYEFGKGRRPSTPVSTPVSTPEDDTAPPAFLQVGDWIYPLLPGRSPVLHASSGAYMFPDVSAALEGNNYKGIKFLSFSKFARLNNGTCEAEINI